VSRPVTLALIYFLVLINMKTREREKKDDGEDLMQSALCLNSWICEV